MGERVMPISGGMDVSRLSVERRPVIRLLVAGLLGVLPIAAVGAA